MISIVKIEEFEKLKRTNIPKAFRDYVERYFLEMTKRFSVNDLSGIGTMFVIESAEDIEKYGLEAFLLKHPPCRVVGMTLFEKNEPLFITHILVKEMDSAAVNIFSEEKYVQHIISNVYKGEVS
ncbi:MAG: hypothetical protein E7580_05990 [Ruminococcaceae bacterium]|nr:hypothetical protein [Oscillospiraceae bacterium]